MGVQAPPIWTPQPPTRVGDVRSALNRLIWFGAIWIVSIAVGWALDFLVFWSTFSSSAIFNLPTNATASQVSAALGPMFQNITILVPAIAGIQLVGIVMLTTGFREFRRIDPSKFSLPSTMMLVLIVGMVIAAVGAIPLLNSLPSIIAQAPSTNGPSQPSAFISAFGRLFLYALVLGAGGLLILIGTIGGMILGLWRVGSMYNETLLKVGAIFVIVPLLSILAPILILLGASSARGQLQENS
jgi:hypothetical protein